MAVAARETAAVRRRLVYGLALAAGISLGGIGIARLLGYRLGMHTVVRCRSGHLFETVWIPGIKLRAIDLGIARLQRCPVGAHWSLVVPVRERSLSGEQRAAAARAGRTVL